MRKRYRVLVLAATVAVLVVPVGLALSIESATVQRASSAAIMAATAVSASIDTSRDSPTLGWWRQVPDGASLFGLGTALIGLAAAVRKTV